MLSGGVRMKSIKLKSDKVGGIAQKREENILDKKNIRYWKELKEGLHELCEQNSTAFEIRTPGSYSSGINN